MTAQVVWQELSQWAKQHQPDFYTLLARDEAYTKAMLAIGRGGKKPRKDLTVWSEAKEYFSFFFPELFAPDYTLPQTVPCATAIQMLQQYTTMLDTQDDSSAFFEKVKQLARTFGYADDMKAYKQNPQQYPGSVADVSMVLRLAVAGRPQSPDLAAVMQVMGNQLVQQRLVAMANFLQNSAG